MICALIMAGGKGTRFWPLSTEEKPKQFLKLIGNETMLQMTVNRILPIIPIERVFVCTAERYIDLVKEQIPNLPARNIIVEPEGRNTAPCIALSAMVIKRYYKDATMVVLPSDHLIKNEKEFRNIIINGNEFLENSKNSIITLGMKPDRPETGYGYIKCGKKIIKGINKVEKFVEKPNLTLANIYIKEGNYLWNGGMFIWKIESIIEKIKKYAPQTYEALHNIDDIEDEKLQSAIDDNYKSTDAISIDYAVLEKADEIYVIPSEIGWDDIGTWKAVERYKEKDDHNNIVNKKVNVIEATSNMVVNNDKKIILIGVDNVMALETKETIYIVNKDYMENLRDYQNKI